MRVGLCFVVVSVSHMRAFERRGSGPFWRARQAHQRNVLYGLSMHIPSHHILGSLAFWFERTLVIYNHNYHFACVFWRYMEESMPGGEHHDHRNRDCVHYASDTVAEKGGQAEEKNYHPRLADMALRVAPNMTEPALIFTDSRARTILG